MRYVVVEPGQAATATATLISSAQIAHVARSSSSSALIPRRAEPPHMKFVARTMIVSSGREQAEFAHIRSIDQAWGSSRWNMNPT